MPSMPDTVNPYIPGQPTDNPKLFFGRREILVSIREHLVKGRRVFLVVGAPRMGKSSLLRQIPAHLPKDFVAVRVDLLEENAQRLDWLLWRVAEAIAGQVGGQAGVDVPPPAWDDFEGHTGFLVDHFWPQVREALGGRVLVLLLDDLDSLAQAPDDLLSYFLTVLGNWRAQSQDLAIVATVSPAAQETLIREHARLFGGVLTFTLGPLTSEEATRLITWPVDGVLTYDYGVNRRLIEATSGHPYYLQLLCFEVFNRCAVAGWVNQHDVDLVIRDILSREIADFRRVWEESSPQEQAVLAALVSLRGARGVATVQEVRTKLHKAGARVKREQVVAALEGLTLRGVLERLGAMSYRFRVALLRDWLAERVDLDDVVRNTRWEDVSAAQVGGRRVPRLTVRKGRRRGKTAPPLPTPAETEGGQEKAAAPVRRRWWPLVVGLLVLALAAGIGLARFRPGPSPATPTATATLRPTLTPRRPTATSAQAAALTPTAPSIPPTDTATPSPSDTPSPTPPVVVARSMPAIAYQSRGPDDDRWYLYVMDSDGSNRTRLMAGQAGFLSAPTWSPDGSRIAFVSEMDGHADIWVVNSDGSNPVNLTQDEAKDHSPAWSPDGEWIAFASVRETAYWELYLMRPDGSDVQRLTWWEDASDLYPTWSPDGTRLAFATKRDGNWEIYTMNRDGSNLVRLTHNPADDTNPAWSPDGSRIAFMSTRDGFAEIYVMPVIGGEAVNLSNAPFSSEHGPTWSPDGGRIAFYSDMDGEWDIYVMASDGSDPIKLTGDTTNDQAPAWRP